MTERQKEIVVWLVVLVVFALLVMYASGAHLDPTCDWNTGGCG